jgi:hypothetical protein
MEKLRFWVNFDVLTEKTAYNKKPRFICYAQNIEKNCVFVNFSRVKNLPKKVGFLLCEKG